MTTLRFDGPGHRLRWQGTLIPRGMTFEVSKGEAASLIRAHPHVNVTVIVPPKARDVAFYWLQSVEDPSVAFLVCDPNRFFKDYHVSIREETQADLDLADAKDGQADSNSWLDIGGCGGDGCGGCGGCGA